MIDIYKKLYHKGMIKDRSYINKYINPKIVKNA